VRAQVLERTCVCLCVCVCVCVCVRVRVSVAHHLTPLRKVLGPDALNDSSAEKAAYGAVENEKVGLAGASLCANHAVAA
jgi:hypothetical protein